MDKKLTLRLNQKTIEKAKEFAKSNNTSLSKMIEAYFSSLTDTENENELKTTPLVKSLSGVIDLPEDFDHKSSPSAYLLIKHK